MQAINHGAVEGNPLADYFVNNNALQNTLSWSE